MHSIFIASVRTPCWQSGQICATASASRTSSDPTSDPITIRRDSTTVVLFGGVEFVHEVQAKPLN